MVETIALRLAEAIKKVDPEKTASVPVMKFALEAILNTFITLCLIGISGWISGEFLNTMAAAGCFAVFRFFSGGLHLKKAMHCSLVSAALIALTPHIELSHQWTLKVTFISLVLILLFAPSNIKGHARIPEKYFPLLKIFSALLVSINFMILSSTLALVFLIQSSATIKLKRR